MKYRILKLAALLIILAHLSSCYKSVKTDRRNYGYGKYRGAGKYW